jgi:hypothetical protein
VKSPIFRQEEITFSGSRKLANLDYASKDIFLTSPINPLPRGVESESAFEIVLKFAMLLRPSNQLSKRSFWDCIEICHVVHLIKVVFLKSYAHN